MGPGATRGYLFLESLMDPVHPAPREGYVDITWARNGQPDESGRPRYRPLPSLVNGEGRVITEWTLTPDERQSLAEGANLRITVLTFGQPIQPLRPEVMEHP